MNITFSKAMPTFCRGSDLPEMALCLLAALRLLKTDPKDLNSCDVNETLDATLKMFQMYKKEFNSLFPCHIHTQQTKNTHQKIFFHLMQIINPADIARIDQLNLQDLAPKKNLVITIKFKRNEREYSYQFTVKYSHNFALHIIYKGMQVTPIEIVQPLCTPSPQEETTGYNPASRWDFTNIPSRTRFLWAAYARKGFVPYNLAKFHDQYIAAVNQLDPNHDLLAKICKKDHPSMKDVENLMLDLNFIFTNKIYDAFSTVS